MVIKPHNFSIVIRRQLESRFRRRIGVDSPLWSVAWMKRCADGWSRRATHRCFIQTSQMAGRHSFRQTQSARHRMRSGNQSRKFANACSWDHRRIYAEGMYTTTKSGSPSKRGAGLFQNNDRAGQFVFLYNRRSRRGRDNKYPKPQGSVLWRLWAGQCARHRLPGRADQSAWVQRQNYAGA